MTKNLIFFCDEINLPDYDKYGTQRVISFMRQLIENQGFYRPWNNEWIRLCRIQFVAACNPSSDPGRKILTDRFLRHTCVLYVDYPSNISLYQIYLVFTKSLFRLNYSIHHYAEALTKAMVEFYSASQAKFKPEIQPQYVYSPREMSRWVRGIGESIHNRNDITLQELVRIWTHEAIRLFSDRLITEQDKIWTFETLCQIAKTHFHDVDLSSSLKQPILFSKWFTNDYVSVDREQLHNYIEARLKCFYEEEMDTELVLFDDLLDQVLRIDRVFRQSQGHILMIGVSGCGKTTLTRFIAWMNGLSVFDVQVHSNYTINNFDEDLRSVLHRAAVE
ncbi:hypothetical protein A3Q56_08505, partial [Intoshia linei]